MKTGDVLFGTKTLPGWEIADPAMPVDELEAVRRQWMNIILAYFEPLVLVNHMLGKPVEVRHRGIRNEFRFSWNGSPCVSYTWNGTNYDNRLKSVHLYVQVDCRIDSLGNYVGCTVYDVVRWDDGKDELNQFTPGGWINELAYFYPEAVAKTAAMKVIKAEIERQELIKLMHLDIHRREAIAVLD